MKIAYLSTDDVNQNLAENLAAKYGASGDCLSPRDPPLNGQYDAVVYDLDSWPPLLGREVLEGLLSCPARYPVAVHSYNLEPEQVEKLSGNGVVVARRLEAQVFKALRLVQAKRNG
jgi:hypothetical protein